MADLRAAVIAALDRIGLSLAAADPGDSALRMVDALRRIADRHHLTDYRMWDDAQDRCAGCGHEPTDEEPDCPDIADLADGLGLIDVAVGRG